MRQLKIDHSNSNPLGTCKVDIGKKGRNLLNAMQSNSDQHRVHKKPKRLRIAFTTEQTNYLEEQFKKYQYINREQRQKVASILKIGERPIKIWFQNRRMKEKKENHKEFDDETCGNAQKCAKDQLNNVPALSSANDSSLYSLSILSFTADTTTSYLNTSNKETNIDDINVKPMEKPESPNSTVRSIEQNIRSPNLYKEANNQEYLLSSYIPQQCIGDSSMSLTKNEDSKKLLSQKYKNTTSAEFSINLCKKYKQQYVSTDSTVSGTIANENQKLKNEPKEITKNETNIFNNPKDSLSSNKCEISYSLPHELPTQMNLSNPMYYPVMPNVYNPPLTSLPSPYMAPDGVLWKPVNFMPLMATNTIDNITHRIPSVHEQLKHCTCNCHGNSQHVLATVPPSLQNPYPHYVVTVPFPHTSPNF